MKEIVKTCIKHGDLTREQIFEEKSNEGLTFRLRCKLCVKEYRDKNIDKLREKSRIYEKTKRKRPEEHYDQCQKKYAREYRRKHADKINDRVRKDRKENREKYLNYDRNWRANNLLKAKELDVIQKHKITYDEYKLMSNIQNGKCAICKQEEKRKSRTSGQICRLAIDHNHETGKVRQLLCHNCNQVVGHCRESIEILKETIKYLKKHN